MKSISTILKLNEFVTSRVMINSLKKTKTTLLLLAVFLMGWNVSSGQTSTQNFGTGTGSNTSQTGNATAIPNPTVGTTWARAGATAPNAPVAVLNSTNPLGSTGSFLKATASTSASVTKASPIVSYTTGLEFYTSFKVLFGDATASNTATTGIWTFYQGLQGTNYNDASDVSSANTFTGLRFTYGASGALTLTFNNAGTYNSTGLTTSAFAQATVYTIEIVGNNKTSGTISYTYNGAAQTVAVQKFDLYINGTLVGNDLAKGGATANTNVNAVAWTGVSSTSNVANLFLDDNIVYNAVPASIGTAPATPTLAVTANTTAAYGTICPGVATTKSFTITNSGTTAASNVVVTSSNAQYVVSALSSTSIAGSNGTATFNVTYTPTTGAAGATIATFYDTSTASGTLGLTGTAVTPVTPAVTSVGATLVVNTTATLNGNATFGICPATTIKGFVYSKNGGNSDPLIGGTNVTGTTVTLGSAGAYTLALTGLTANTAYKFKAYISDGTIVTYSTVQSFTTLPYCIPSGSTADGISGVTFSDMTNTGTGLNSYTNYTTTKSAAVTQGTAYNLSVFVNTGGNFTNTQKAWIDWNGDGVFNTTAGTSSGTGA